MTTAPSPSPRRNFYSKKPVPPPPAAPPEVVQTEAEVKASVVSSATGLGLTERRRLVRPLPTPQVLESEGDSDWAIFQTLISDNQKI